MDEHWTANTDIELHTDASDLAIGGYYAGAWFSVPLTESQRNMSINWRELYAIVVAIATWGHKFQSKQLLIHCDNQAVCSILNSGTSKKVHLMDLVRLLFYHTAI